MASISVLKEDIINVPDKDSTISPEKDNSTISVRDSDIVSEKESLFSYEKRDSILPEKDTVVSEKDTAIVLMKDITASEYKERGEPVLGACQHRLGKSLETGIFCCPNSITIDHKTKNVFICDAGNDRVQVLTSTLEFSFEFNDNMDTPFGVCISQNKVYVTQSLGDHLNVYSIEGKFLELVGSRGDKELQFDYPTGVAVSTEKNIIYVCDMENNRIQCLNMNLTFNSFILNIKWPQDIKLTWNKIIVLSLDEKCVRFYDYAHKLIEEMIPIGVGIPTQLCLDPDNNILISDGVANCISIFTPNGKLIHKLGLGGTGRGKFLLPSGIAVDSNNRIILVSQNEKRCVQLY